MNLIVCARVPDDVRDDYGRWRARYQSAMLAARGADSIEYVPSSAEQPEHIVVARFSSPQTLLAWRRSERNRALLDELRAMAERGVVTELAGLAADDYAVQHSVTEVIVTKIKPGREEEYRAVADRFQEAQERSPGYLGSYVQPPTERESGWATVLRFDSVDHLEEWLNSSERARLIEESDHLTEGFEARRIDTSFPGWTVQDAATGETPNMWKTSALVLLTLFPVVMFEVKFLSPLTNALNPSLGMFIGNTVSVALTTWPLMPIAIALFRPWLYSKRASRRAQYLAPAALAAGYAAEVLLLWHLLG